MERCPVRIGPAVAGLLLAAIASGCNALGPGKDARAGEPTFYDEFFGPDEVVEAAPSSADEADEDGAASPRFFKRNRLPGGLSPEAREIERGSFNIY